MSNLRAALWAQWVEFRRVAYPRGVPPGCKAAFFAGALIAFNLIQGKPPAEVIQGQQICTQLLAGLCPEENAPLVWN